MLKTPLYQAIASISDAARRCVETGNSWQITHEMRRDYLVSNLLPSGSGFDNGTSFDDVRSNADRLIFNTSFHHMDENGTYDGWTQHTVTVKADLVHGIIIRVTGRNRNAVKEYIAETFGQLLRLEDDWTDVAFKGAGV